MDAKRALKTIVFNTNFVSSILLCKTLINKKLFKKELLLFVYLIILSYSFTTLTFRLKFYCGTLPI